MIAEYLNSAMRRARYEIIDDPEPYYGEIPECPGVWATGKNLEDCRQSLLDALEGWLILSLERTLPIPSFDGISLKPEEPAPVDG
jgi:predicted RNase H-like HicB family nuclease